MENPGSSNNKENEGSFYKGLFFGLLLGVGLIWFMGTPTGKEFVKRARKRIDETLAVGPGMEDYEEGETSAAPEPEPKSTASSPPRRFFRKSE